MNEKKLVSIVLPTYNRGDKFLKRAIDSVISQTYQKWELLIIDNSTDKIRLENIISDVPPIIIPHADPKVSPEIKIVTVINSMFGISNKENPRPMASAAKIAARTNLFSFIISP